MMTDIPINCVCGASILTLFFSSVFSGMYATVKGWFCMVRLAGQVGQVLYQFSHEDTREGGGGGLNIEGSKIDLG